MKLVPHILAVLLFAAARHPARADDFAARCADRAAIERVYHAHRLGTKQPFEQAMQALIEQVVRQDQHKETVLRKVYGMEITPAMVAAEVERINTTTRAPEVLAEIKHALGDAAARFAATMARPIVVERELRRRFDNDDKLHAAQRREAEQERACLLAKKPVANMHDVTWQLTPRPADGKSEVGGQSRAERDSLPKEARRGAAEAASKSEFAAPATPTQAKAKSSAYTNEATAQVAQSLTPPEKAAPGNDKHYFEDLDSELQKVLRVQLQKPGDVSAVIEAPGGFLVFVTREKSTEKLAAASLSVAKQSYEEWLTREP